jgi:hypothetical protein
VNDFAALGKLIQNLEHLGSHGSEAVGAKLEPAIQQVVESQYDQGKGPDGEKWANKADGTPSNLQKSGVMRSRSQVVAGVKGVTVRIPSPGGWHQGGTSRMPARPLVPEGDQLPREWEKAAQEAAAAVIREGLK